MSDEITKEPVDKGCCSGQCGCESDSGCGCGHDHGHHPNTITLTLDNNEEVECDVLGIFDVDEQSYMALLPNGREDVFIYGYSEDETGNVSLKNIDSQEDFDQVSAVFLDLIDEEATD